MEITLDTPIAALVSDRPATIAVFQRHGIDFCCGGKRSLASACQTAGLDSGVLVAELEAAMTTRDDTQWPATITGLVAHIQRTYHVPLREELPRLAQMLDKVVARHGETFSDMLPPLQRTFEGLRQELLLHMAKEDAGLFPALLALDNDDLTTTVPAEWLKSPVDLLVSEHEDAGAALAEMRRLTDGYTPPPDACPTFRGLYFGLEQLEQDMHLHVHLENNVLFPKAAARAGARASA